MYFLNHLTRSDGTGLTLVPVLKTLGGGGGVRGVIPGDKIILWYICWGQLFFQQNCWG